MKKLTVENFIEKAKKIHSNKYDYSKVEYINTMTKICIICPIHGEFWQTPAMHLHGNGCPKCKAKKQGDKCRKKIDDFIQEAKNVHGNKYDYSKVNYINNSTKVCIICPIHGEFSQTPKTHINQKCGCPECSSLKKLTNEKFIEKAKNVHGNKYDYTKSQYKNTRTKLIIVCPKHGEFLQTPHSHLHGDGCPNCNFSHLENEIETMLKENNINYECQKRFKWLGKQSLDFFLPEYNIAIECQGSQHYIPYEYFGGKKALSDTKMRDEKKKKLCSEHNIQLLYYGKHKNCIKNKKIIFNKILKNENNSICWTL